MDLIDEAWTIREEIDTTFTWRRMNVCKGRTSKTESAMLRCLHIQFRSKIGSRSRRAQYYGNGNPHVNNICPVRPRCFTHFLINLLDQILWSPGWSPPPPLGGPPPLMPAVLVLAPRSRPSLRSSAAPASAFCLRAAVLAGLAPALSAPWPSSRFGPALVGFRAGFCWFCSFSLHGFGRCAAWRHRRSGRLSSPCAITAFDRIQRELFEDEQLDIRLQILGPERSSRPADRNALYSSMLPPSLLFCKRFRLCQELLRTYRVPGRSAAGR